MPRTEEHEAVAQVRQPGHAELDDLSPRTGVQQYLRFVLAGDACAVRIDAVLEILEISRITPLPKVPAFVAGVTNTRGSVMPVFDLAARLGLPGIQLGERSCIVVVEVERTGQAPLRLGLLVDAVHEVFDATDAEQDDVPRLGTRVAPQYLRSMLRRGGVVLPEIDVHCAFEPTRLARLVTGAEMLP